MLQKIIISLLLFSSLQADTKILNFDNIPTNTLPKSWIISATHQRGGLSTWKVIKLQDTPSGKKSLTLTNINAISGSTFNLCYTKSINFKDGSISVKFKANSGNIDQGGGIMWRVEDNNNYYVARFNPLEDNFRFYRIKDGNRRELASSDVRLNSGWHTMKIVQNKNNFKAYLDNKLLLNKDDTTFKKAGGVGLWTKADAATSFDDFIVKSK